MAYSTYDTPGEFFNISPTTGAYSLASATISIGCGDHATPANQFLTNLTAAQAHLTTGSTAQVLFALNDALYQRFNSILTADKPTKFSIRRSGATDEATNELVYTYTTTIRVAVGSLVAANT
jgi:hypothetical protein